MSVKTTQFAQGTVIGDLTQVTRDTYVLHFLERIAVALETLASDVKPPASKPLETVYGGDALPLARKGGDGDTLPAFGTAQMTTQETVSVKLQEVGGPRVVEGSAAVPPGADWKDEAKRLEAELVAQEEVKSVLGDFLHRTIWTVPHDGTADQKTATFVRDEAVKVLDPETWAKTRDALGVKPGQLPTGAQMRRLAVEFLVPAAKANAAPEHGDAWEGS